MTGACTAIIERSLQRRDRAGLAPDFPCPSRPRVAHGGRQTQASLLRAGAARAAAASATAGGARGGTRVRHTRSMPTRLTRPRIEGQQLAVSCGHPLAVQAALRVGAQGGNAADAAAAAAAALAVILPDACGLGGDLLCIVRQPDGSTFAINGVGAAPQAMVAPLQLKIINPIRLN